MPAASASRPAAGETGATTPAASRLHKDGGGGGGSSDDDEDETPLGLWLHGAAFPSNGSAASSGYDRFDLAQRTFSTLKHEWITAGPSGHDPYDQRPHAPAADAAMARTYAWVEATLTALGFSEEVLPVNAPADDALGLEQPTADGDVSLVARPPRRAYCAARESVSLAAAAAMLLASAPHRHHHSPDSALVQARALSAAFTAPAHQQQRDPDCDDDGGGRVSVLALGVSVLFCVALECECLEEAVGMLEPELRYLIDAQRAISRTAHHSTAGITSSASVAVLAVHGSPAGSTAGSPNAAVTDSSRSPPPQLRCLVGDPRCTVAAERQYRRVALTAAMATLVYSTGHATTSRSSRKTARGNGSSRGANQGGGGGATAQQHQRSNSGATDRPLLGSQAQSPGHTAAPSPRDGASLSSPKHPHAASNGHTAFPGANDSTSSAAASLGFAGASHGGMPFMDGGSMMGGVAPTPGGGGSFANSFTQHNRNFGSDSVATRPGGAGPGGGASSSARPHPLASPFGAAGQAGTARQYLGFTPTGDCLSERAAFGAPTLAGAQSSLVTDGVAGSWGRSQGAGTDTGTTPGAHSLTNAALMGLGPPARSPVADTWHMRSGDAAGGGSDRGSSPRTMNPMRQGQIGSGSPTTPAPPAELPPPGSGHNHPGGSATSAAADTAAHRQEFVRQIGVAVTGLLLSGRSAGHTSMLAKRSALHAAAAAGYHWHAAPTILAAIAREADEGSLGPDVTKGLWYAPDTPGACIAPALRTRLSLPREMHFSSVVVVAAPPDQLADADPTASVRVDSEAARPPTGRSLRALRSGQESLRLTPKGPASSQASHRSHRSRRSTRGSVNGPQLPAHRGGSAVALECSTEILNHPDGGDRAEGDDASSHRTQPTRREAKYRVKNPADLPPEEQDARKCCAGGCIVA